MPNPSDAKKSFAKLLREHGFEGSAPTFRRFRGKDSVAVVNLQASGIQPGGTYINLGVHLRGLDESSSWEKSAAKKTASAKTTKKTPVKMSSARKATPKKSMATKKASPKKAAIRIH